MRSRSLRRAGGALAFAAFVGGACAQAFPSKPVTLLLPFPAGSPIDIESRPLGQYLEKTWGQPFVIEPRPGAGGLVAMRAVAKAPADGHTLAVGTATLSAYKVLFKDADVDPLKDLAPISLFVEFPGGFVTNTQVPARTIDEFLAYARANPGKVNYGSLGPNTTMLLLEAFKRAAGVPLTEVPFGGPPQMMTSLLRNDIQVMNHPLSLATKGQVESGQLRPLLMVGSKRASLFPDVPSSAEKGWNLPRNGWTAIVAPGGTSPAIQDRIAADVARWAATPETQKRAKETGMDYPTTTPAEMRRLIETDSRMWSEVANAVGLKPQ